MIDFHSYSPAWLLAISPFLLFFKQVMSFFKRIVNLFIIEAEFLNESAVAITFYINKHGKQLKSGVSCFSGRFDFIKPLNKSALYGYELSSGRTNLFFLHNKMLLISNFSGKDKTTEKWFESKLKIISFRGWFDFRKILEIAIDEYNEVINNNQCFSVKYIYGRTKTSFEFKSESAKLSEPTTSNHQTLEFNNAANKLIKYKLEDIGYGCNEKFEFPDIFCDESVKLFNRVKQWQQSKEWYKSKQIPWRQGALLYGKPGSGKTFLINNICKALDIPIFVFDLASLSNAEMIERWKECQQTTPSVILIEDIDTVYKLRENITGEKGGGLSFDCLLNCLSGIIPCSGFFTFITSNNIQNLDPALGIPNKGESTRPGRLDIILELNNTTEGQRLKIANRILCDSPDIIPGFVEQGKDTTAAQFADMCASEALRRYWA